MSSRLLLLAATLIAALLMGCSGSSTGPSNAPKVNVSDAVVARGAEAVFTVSLSATSSSPVIFHYATSPGTAVAGTDYTTKSGVDTVTAGQLNTTVTINTIRGAVAVGEKTFNLTLSGATNGTLNDSLGICTIQAFGGLSFFANDVQPILVANCAITNCHGIGSNAGGLAMGTADYATIASAQGAHGYIIRPRSPLAPIADSSSLYFKVDTTKPPLFGNPMPYGASPLSATQQQKIKDWIDEGAQNN